MKSYYDGQGHEVLAKQPGSFLLGKVSYSEKLRDSGKPAHRTWYGYDERGRVIWMQQQVAGLGRKTVSYSYNS